MSLFFSFSTNKIFGSVCQIYKKDYRCAEYKTRYMETPYYTASWFVTVEFATFRMLTVAFAIHVCRLQFGISSGIPDFSIRTDISKIVSMTRINEIRVHVKPCIVK